MANPKTKASSGGVASTGTPVTARFRLKNAARIIDINVGSELTIGRAKKCQVQLTSGLISRTHARLRGVDDGLVVEDLDSRNGVLVNRRKISEPTLVVHGDLIGVGSESFEVVDEHVLRHPAHLSTLPPSAQTLSWSAQAHPAPAQSPIPPGDGEVDGPEQRTLSAHTTDILSPREHEVLKLFALGYTHREIAERLSISVKTIETHRAHISEKLNCRTRAELVTYAIATGLLRIK